ncbi:RNA recognition motif domain-containing protein [Variovorax sp. VNK109]|jgi:cold-inducible RNA-binding protein|uniref:RNA recognition motif domain-containing protein n=1 Tax=Variovorax sp. VNK109 TaxID=3400919 RepID=UPI003C07D794
MENKLYIGNLSYDVDDSTLQHQFAEYGTVNSAKVVIDRESGRSKGFGFVEMSSANEAQTAIDGMNGKSVGGRALTVNVARPMEKRSGGGYQNGGGRY